MAFWTGLGCGRRLAGLASSTSSMGIEKQKQHCNLFFDFGLDFLAGRCVPPVVFFSQFARPCCFSFAPCCKFTRPSLSASVSRLDRASKMGWAFALGPGLDWVERLACSLCCQQYRLSSLGSSFGVRRMDTGAAAARAMDRRHARPLEVMPQQVELGSRESERPRRDSGVLATKGIVDNVDSWRYCSIWEGVSGEKARENSTRSPDS